MPATMSSSGATLTNFVDYIVENALRSRASDIHLEPDRDKFNVRFRIDGILYPIESFDNFSKDEITTRLKVLSQLDIAEHRFPQDGHFEFNFGEKIHNVRVSVLPTIHGEAIVLRIFNRNDIFIKIDQLGFDPTQLELMNKLLTSPSGMILTTGPTGSGKTTLLYSILHTFNKPERNIITLEDPIEFQMPLIRQTQVNEAIGFNFAKAMRSVIRQDPDIVMLGEIRDPDTAQMAIQAALTGILVLSTFHTFDVPALVTRLQEIGFSGSVIAQAVTAVISTRLIRKICDKCKSPYTPSDEERKSLGDTALTQVYKGQGCQVCQKKGYLGRTGIFEIVYFDQDLKNAITDRKSASVINEILRTKKIKSLRESALDKVAKGETTVEELLRVTGSLS